MGKLKDLVRQQRERMGQEAGQTVGHAALITVPHPSSASQSMEHEKPQNPATNASCPTVPTTKARDSGTDTEDVGASAGTGAGTAPHPKIAEARLRQWHALLSSLDPLQPPFEFLEKDWAQLVDDACWLYEVHASYAVRNGWPAQSLFGVRLGHAFSGGVAQLLQSCRSVVFDGPHAFVRSYGVTLKRNVHCGDGLPLIWEIGR